MLEDNRFDAMIESAKEFIDLVEFDAHQVGIVDYSGNGQVSSYPLTTDSTDLKTYLDQIVCGGGTYTHDAIYKGMEVLEQGREDAQPVMILLTDGQAKNDDWAMEAATAAKEAGIVFYTIALLAPDEDPAASLPNSLMMQMATTALHHHFVLGSVGLIDIYRAIVEEIGISSAYDVTITETVNDAFEIVPGSYENNIPQPTVDGNTLTWKIQELKANTLNLSYKVKLKDGGVAGTYSVAPSTKITYKDYAGASRSYSVANTSLVVMNYPPVITEVTPGQGLIEGGEEVTIKGENFLPGATVKFKTSVATTTATNVEVKDSNTINVTAPAGAHGTATIIVTNPDTQTATAAYSYMTDPIVTSISPNSGVFEGGNNVKINGQYFLQGLTVYFGDQVAPLVNFYNSGYVMVKAPKAEKAGAVDVTIVNPDGTTVTVADGYTYDEEIIEKLEIYTVSPNSGYIIGGSKVTITGDRIEAGAKVYFGDVEAKVDTTTSTTKRTVTVPAVDKEGMVNVTIENPDGETAVLTDAYEYLPLPAPTITSISPNEGKLAGGEIVTITGTGLRSGLTVTVGGNEAQIYNYYDSTRIRIRIPAAVDAGMVDVILTNPDGQQVTVTEGYEYLPDPEAPAPTISDVSPNQTQVDTSIYMYINGSNFVSGATVTVGGQEATVANYYSSAKLRVKVPTTEEAGTCDVVVTNPDGKEAVLTDAFEYLPLPEEAAPEITAISANEGEMIGGEYVYIDGKNFKSGMVVTFGTEVATIANFYSSSRIRIKVPAAASAGTVDVTVTNPSGKSHTVAGAYTYKPYVPVITSLSVPSGLNTTTTITYIYGKNFTNGLTVTVDGVEVEILNYYSSTSIRVKVPVSTTVGPVDVVVQNPDGSVATLSGGFEYLEPAKDPDPEISHISLSSAVTGTPITSSAVSKYVYMHGTGFVTSGTKKTQIRIIDANGVTHDFAAANIYDSKRIRFKIPATVASGVAQIFVVNGDVVSAPFEFTIQ